MNKHIKKQIINLGHNNPPEVFRIEFTNSAIEKLNIDDLGFGNKEYIEIPFNVPKGSHLKGLYLKVSRAKQSKKFSLRFWLSGRNHKMVLGDYRPYRNSNDLGFTCVQVNKKQYDIYNEHTNDKGLYTTSPKISDKIKETKITDHQLEVLDSLTLRDIIMLICEAGFPKYAIEGAFLSRIHLASIFKFLAGYNWRAKHIRIGDDTKGMGTITFKVNPNFSRFNVKTKAPTTFKELFKKFPSGTGILSKEKHFNPTGSISLYDDEFSKTMIKDLFNAELGPPLIEAYLEKYQDVMQLDGSFKRQLVKTNTIDFSEKPRNSSGSYFVGHASYDDFSTDYDVGRENVGAEFSQYELDRYSKPEPRTQFDSKVEEDIYRAKKFLLKKNGHWD